MRSLLIPLLFATSTALAAPVPVELSPECKKVTNFFMAKGQLGSWDDASDKAVSRIITDKRNLKEVVLSIPGFSSLEISTFFNHCTVLLTISDSTEGVQITHELAAQYNGVQLDFFSYLVESLDGNVKNETPRLLQELTHGIQF